MQTTFAAKDDGGEWLARGNCLQAALASIFDLDLDDVPHFVGMGEDVWWEQFWLWLRARNIEVHYERVAGDDGEFYGWRPLQVPYLLGGPSPRGEFSHVVVAKNHEVIHDPHPDGTGLAPGWRGVYYFIPLDPAKQPLASDEPDSAVSKEGL